MPRFKVVRFINKKLPVPDYTVQRLLDSGIELDVLAPPAERGDLERLAGDADLLWDYIGLGRITRQDLEALKRCGAIVKVGSGTDHIDVKAATELGIIVANTPYVLTDCVSDHAISLLFSLVRQVTRHDRLIRAGHWDVLRALPLRRFQGATLGLVGFGRIAQAVAKKLSGFGMNIIAFDPLVPAGVMAALGVEAVTLDTLLGTADYVSLHCPLTNETRHLISERELRQMRPHALLVNTSRGPVVDERALIKALQGDWIKGAALDVVEAEPLGPDSPLRTLDNVILTPHIAGHSDRFPDDYAEACVEAILDLFQRRWPRSVVNPEVKPRWGDLSAPRNG